MSKNPRSLWEHFPIWLILAMGIVVAVNARFITLAVTTFPGAASADDFDTSNNYNMVLASVDRQNALGWRVRVDAAAVPAVIVVCSRTGVMLRGVHVSAVARAPVGDIADRPVALIQVGDGRFAIAKKLAPGQWDLLLRIAADGNEMRVTRRVLLS